MVTSFSSVCYSGDLLFHPFTFSLPLDHEEGRLSGGGGGGGGGVFKKEEEVLFVSSLKK